MKIRKGDEVVVIAGKDRDKRGTVTMVDPQRNKVIVEGVNLVKRHTAARGRAQAKSEIVVKPMPIDASNVMLVHKGERTRIGYRVNADGTKVRIAKSTGEEI